MKSIFSSELALTPDSLPPGKVGVPYSKTLMAAGGTGPYSISLYGASDLPAGLTFSNGAVSSTLSSAGNYLLAVIVRDTRGTSTLQHLSIGGRQRCRGSTCVRAVAEPIQIYYEIGSPNPPPVPVSVTTTSGVQPFQVSMSSIPGVTLASGAGTTNANLNLNVTSVSAGTYAGLLGGVAAGAANVSASTSRSSRRATTPTQMAASTRSSCMRETTRAMRERQAWWCGCRTTKGNKGEL